MRVAGGTAKGRTLRTAKGLAVRPTADKVKQAIFNVLGRESAAKKVLDLFAGSGALGIEALSRGATFCVFLDESRHAEEAIRRNVAECGFGTRADVFRKRFPASLEFLRARKDRFDLVLVDPPYGKETIYPILKVLLAADIFLPGAVVVAEHEAGDPVRADVLGAKVLQEKRYGGTAVTFLEI